MKTLSWLTQFFNYVIFFVDTLKTQVKEPKYREIHDGFFDKKSIFTF